MIAVHAQALNGGVPAHVRQEMLQGDVRHVRAIALEMGQELAGGARPGVAQDRQHGVLVVQGP